MSLEEILHLYLDVGKNLVAQILNPTLTSSLTTLLGVSILIWSLELIRPWRTHQSSFRKDFFLDMFYMFFNFFLAPWLFLNLIYMISYSYVGRHLDALPSLSISSWPGWIQILLLFLIQDFSHYWIHRLLHRVPFLWKYHQVHHSVEEMGFAAHLRYHWMENVVYKSIGSIPFFAIGFSPLDLFWVHLITLTIGHLNHANIGLTYGPLKWILNHPVMHLWHHAKTIPEGHRYGVNYGISLSVWDLIFKTGVWSHPPADLPLGFIGRENFPNGFLAQNLNLFGPVRPLSEEESA